MPIAVTGGSDDDGAALRDAKPTQDDPAAELLRSRVKSKLLGAAPKPPTVGRFTVLDHVGAGAMGAVYAAYDPVLDRRVALKVLEADADVLREARALAKLAHPNVVTVHEADETDGFVFIAMELVEGEDLSTWLAAKRREPDEIVDVLRAAGEGLAAAHDAGVVHSDFKPANVLVGTDRVRVADFGVARTGGDESSGGTPAYMAPEQRRGEAATAASDQYAFGLTLGEALGDTPPPRIRNVVRRATAEDPADRYTSMRSLLTEMAPRPKRSYTWIFVAAAALAAMVIPSWDRDPCDGGVELADAVLPNRANVAVEPYAERIERALAEYRETWLERHRNVCEATRVRKIQSDSAYDARMACLARRLDETSALVTAIQQTRNEREAARAVGALGAAIGDLEKCDVARATTATDDRVAAKVDEARAAYRLGRYEQSVDLSRDAVAAAASDDPSSRAEARLALGMAEGRTGTGTAAATYRLALEDAARAERDDLAAEIWVWILKDRMFAGGYEDVLAQVPYARAAALRAKVPDTGVDGVHGEALLQSGRVDEAIVKLRAVADRKLRPDRAPIVHSNLGRAYLAAGDAKNADTQFERAHEIALQNLGEGHPGLGYYLEKLGRSRLALGDAKRALELCTQAEAIRVQAYGADDRAVATSALCGAEALLALDRLDEAETRIRRARRIRRAVYPPEHPSFVSVDLAAGALACKRGDKARTRALADEVTRRAKAISPAHPALHRASKLRACATAPESGPDTR